MSSIESQVDKADHVRYYYPFCGECAVYVGGNPWNHAFRIQTNAEDALIIHMARKHQKLWYPTKR